MGIGKGPPAGLWGAGAVTGHAGEDGLLTWKSSQRRPPSPPAKMGRPPIANLAGRSPSLAFFPQDATQSLDHSRAGVFAASTPMAHDFERDHVRPRPVRRSCPVRPGIWNGVPECKSARGTGEAQKGETPKGVLTGKPDGGRRQVVGGTHSTPSSSRRGNRGVRHCSPSRSVLESEWEDRRSTVHGEARPAHPATLRFPARERRPDGFRAARREPASQVRSVSTGLWLQH